MRGGVAIATVGSNGSGDAGSPQIGAVPVWECLSR